MLLTSSGRKLWQPWLVDGRFLSSNRSVLLCVFVLDEARSYSSKELPSTKWRKERRGNLHSRGASDGPLDFSSRAPPSYDQSMRYKNSSYNSSRPSVIQSVVNTSPPLPSPPLGKRASIFFRLTSSHVGFCSLVEDVCDPAIDEHFRRSLGKDYSSIFSPVKTVNQSKSNESDTTGLSGKFTFFCL